MQVYAMRFFNFLRFGEKNNSIVFDLTSAEKQSIKEGRTTLDKIYDRVMLSPLDHIKNVNSRGIEKVLGITGLVDGNPDSSNGAGKSSLMEGICYAHYEKIVRKTANTDKVEKAGLSVVTKIDGKYPEDMKESYVEELFESEGRVYRLKRGRSFSKNQKTNTPFIEFDCLNKDEGADSQSGHRTSDTKTALSDVITMDYDVFVNSQMFGQNDAGKYLTGTDKTKKEMLINLLRLEDVVSGCLDLIRTKKNLQDKKVQATQANVLLLENIFCEAYAKKYSLKNEELIFEPSYVSKILSSIDLLNIETMESIRQLGKEEIDIDTKISDLSKSEKISKIDAIREEGKKTQRDKKSKETEMSSQISEWEKLKQESIRAYSSKKKQVDEMARDISEIESQIVEKNKAINSFDKVAHEKFLQNVKKAKELKPVLEKKLGDSISSREVIVNDITAIKTKIQRHNDDIEKLNKQLRNVDANGKFICDECKSLVSKEHVVSKIKENEDFREEKRKLAEELEKNKSVIDAEMSDSKVKIQKCDNYIVSEAKVIASYNVHVENGKRLVEIKKQKEQIESWISDGKKEMEEMLKREAEYEEKCKAIRRNFENDLIVLKAKIDELVINLSKAIEDAKDVNSQIESLKVRQREIASNKTKLNEKIGSMRKEKEHFESQSRSLNEKRDLLTNETKTLQRLLFLESVFGLDGIQTRIVKKYLPLLNVYVKEFLDILSNGEMSIKMIINDKSKVDMVITGGTADTFEMLSGGEKMIVRLATDIGLALLAFSRSAHKPEIICLDEIFGPLDNSHTESVFKMLQRLQDRFNRVLIITHKTEIKDMLKNHIVIEKMAGKMGLSEIKRIE